jgi:hypothetical protein
MGPATTNRIPSSKLKKITKTTTKRKKKKKEEKRKKKKRKTEKIRKKDYNGIGKGKKQLLSYDRISPLARP